MLKLHGWPEGVPFMQNLMRVLNDPDVVVGNDLDIYPDDYAFLAEGIPCATLRSRTLGAGASSGAFRGYQHTSMDTLEKVSGRYIQIDAIRVACIGFEIDLHPDVTQALRHDLPPASDRVPRHRRLRRHAAYPCRNQMMAATLFGVAPGACRRPRLPLTAAYSGRS